MLSAKQIEIFYEVYKNTSMTAAAESLEISQPSISKTLRIIEKKLNFKLFLRQGKKLVPTHEADDLFEHASVVHSQLKSFNAIANTYKTRSADYINIGTTPSLAEGIIPKIIKKYNKINPDVRFNLINLNSIDLIEGRYKPDIDLTICFNTKNQPSSRSAIIKEGNLTLVSPIEFELPDEIYLKDITTYPFVEITNLLSFYEESSLSNYIKNNGINMNTIVKTDSYSSALSIVEDGMAISILDDSTLSKADYKKVKKTKIMDKDFKYTISAIKKDIVRYECNEFFNYLCEENL
jgi:LysR family nitrogen assimilation transcriptional regulator